MKTDSASSGAFSRVELLVVIATVAVLATLFVGAQVNPGDEAMNKRLACLANLKHVGLAFRMFSNDHDDKFPMQIPAAKGGSQEAIEKAEAFRHFQAIGKALAGKPKLLVCPADQRPVAADFAHLKNENIDYFVGIDADETRPQMLLSGDRNITNGTALVNAVLELSEQPVAGWTAALHNGHGNVGMADGSAQQVTTAGLRRAIEAAKMGNAVRGGKTRIQLPESGSSSVETEE